MTSTLGARPHATATDRALSGARLLGLGAAQPERSVRASELGAPFGRTAEWVRARTGIDAVRRTGHEDEIERLAARAAASALARAGVIAGDVDLVLTASCSLDRPATSRITAAVAPNAGWMAMNAACSGFCFAISSADNLIRTGMARRVLVVAAEQMSALLDPADLGTSIIFGDGAGAAVLGPAVADQQGIGPLVSGSDGALNGLIACDDAGFLRMAGREVFRWAVESMPAIALDACERAGVAIADIDVFVPHQANGRIIAAVADELDLGNAVVACDISGSGNTSAASIPIALTRLLEEDAALSGRLALLLGFGAGLAYAGQVVRLP
ncbi:MAG: 3-oxoacyl-[acyl-carrier-protein] synthase [Actinomycetota bacterium]|nr:3-oxoacyl-[acyl-carrier-protein] synthase [Actinomycetota bacterium]